MGSTGSVTYWIERLKAGEPAAAQQLWEGYFDRLVRLARARLAAAPRRAADEEDAALSAFDSFCRGAEQGRFPQLRLCAGKGQSSLWGTDAQTGLKGHPSRAINCLLSVPFAFMVNSWVGVTKCGVLTYTILCAFGDQAGRKSSVAGVFVSCRKCVPSACILAISLCSLNPMLNAISLRTDDHCGFTASRGCGSSMPL